MSDNLLSKLKALGGGIARDEAGSVPNRKEGRDDTHERHPQFSCRLERETGDGCSVIYGMLLGGAYYNASHGIQFVFEGVYQERWGEPEFNTWLVSIEGRLLENVWHHLCQSKEQFVREKDDDGERRTITVRPHKLKGYAPEKK